MSIRVLIKEANVHRLFEIALLLKALHSLLEIVGGALLSAMSTDAVLRIAKFVTQGELLEDPNDLIANYLLQVAQDLSVSSKAAAAFFLLSHGSVKLALVLAVMRGWAWAYPAFLGALGLLIGYQSYQLWHVFSVGLTALTIFDVLVFVLTWHEYRLVRISKRDA
jgi:uncharacterized membrane protein